MKYLGGKNIILAVIIVVAYRDPAPFTLLDQSLKFRVIRITLHTYMLYVHCPPLSGELHCKKNIFVRFRPGYVKH